ncbi:hypothetical protein Z043_111477 [Scleropages formosus]|uniref:Insulin-like domain-containing protein n=1 Tax=Scleropages formosus TaxID=113540 RepID=A0A0P7UM02_SCLFO|nr:hypothetical protein Z043_111477 [Scleropages formosus]
MNASVRRLPPAPQVCCWWCGVCVLYPVLCLAALRGGAEAMKARCGRELVADLEFVCGDRGFYRGERPNAKHLPPRASAER